jgi:hypothetical protein
MVHDADACMYAAKQQGGDQVRLTVVCTNVADQDRTLLASCVPLKRYFQHRGAERPVPRSARLDAAS